MTPVEKYRKLVVLLWGRTKERSILWKWDAPSKSISCLVGNRPIVIRQTQNDNYEDLYVFTIFNDRSEPVEFFNDEMIGGEDINLDGYRNYFQLSEALFTTAQKQATGADVALDEIISSLEKNGNNSAF